MTAKKIAAALGGRKSGSGWLARCLAHNDRSPSLSIDDGKDGKVLFHCFAGCSPESVIAELRRRGLWADLSTAGVQISDAEREKRQAKSADKERKQERREVFTDRLWRGTWQTAAPARGSPVENWIRARGIPLDPATLDRMPLRWTTRCPIGKATAPAMLALMTDAVTAEPCGLHRTYLTADGSAKAFGKESRKMLGSAGIIRLSPDDEVSEGLGICEGIETGLAIMAAGWRPIWACGSLDALKQFPPLAGIECLTIFADPKPHEIAGARACADCWAEAGSETIVRIPRDGDWADALQVAA